MKFKTKINKMGDEEKSYLENIAKQVSLEYVEMNDFDKGKELLRVRDLINIKGSVDLYKKDLEFAEAIYKLL